MKNGIALTLADTARYMDCGGTTPLFLRGRTRHCLPNNRRRSQSGAMAPQSRTARLCLVRQFHDVIETTGIVILPDVQDGELAEMRARDGFKPLDALEFALEGPGIDESIAVNDLHRTALAQDIAREPDIAITPAANAPEQFVVGDGRCTRPWNGVVPGQRTGRCGC